MNNKTTTVYAYGRSTIDTPEIINSLNTPEGLTSWFEKKSATKAGLVENNELFFTMDKLTEEEIVNAGVIYLGDLEVPYFYMSEKICEQYVTYITSDSTGPGMVLYPVTWEDAKIYIFRRQEGSPCYQWPLCQIVEETTIPDSLLCTRELALKYGVGLNNPYQDPYNSETVKAILAHLAKKVEEAKTLPTDDAGIKQGI